MKSSALRLLSLLAVLIVILLPALAACGNKDKCADGHTYTNSCDTICDVCSAVRETEHTYTNSCDTVCDVCSAVRETEHTYTNSCDTVCDVCSAVRETEHTYISTSHTDCEVCGEGLFDLLNVPAFDNSVEYVEINGNIPYFTTSQIVRESYAYYSELDELGRSGVAVACLGADLFPDSDRGSLPDPTGWHSNSIYERSHLIAHSLAGFDKANNLITGTYDLNGVMQTFEEMVKKFIIETNYHVMYRVTPIFNGNDLVARGVVMEGWSVEDNGEGICFNIYIYNEQDDETIDHATGDVTLPITSYTYVVNKNGWKIHEATCSYVAAMNDANKFFWTGTYDELIAHLAEEGHQNYTNCKSCKPES